MAKESVVEKHLIKQVKKRNGFTRKFTCPGHRGVPDRICFFPPAKGASLGIVVFVEVKAENGVPSKLQIQEILRIRKMGTMAVVITGHKGVDQFMEDVDAYYRDFGQTAANKRNQEQKAPLIITPRHLRK